MYNFCCPSYFFIYLYDLYICNLNQEFLFKHALVFKIKRDNVLLIDNTIKSQIKAGLGINACQLSTTNKGYGNFKKSVNKGCYGVVYV